MKTIVVKWVPEEEFGYGMAMRVIASDHPRFSVGTRFDFGFFSLATAEGYTIVSLPMKAISDTQQKSMGTCTCGHSWESHEVDGCTLCNCGMPII